MAADPRKVVLYQGVFGPDRDVAPYARAIEKMGGDFALYLMGPTSTPESQEYVRHLCDEFSCVTFAWAGLMPYTPTWNNRYSPFNALYCAPNKIWEYTRFGLPVIASDVPGIRLALERGDFGCVVDAGDEATIARAIEDIDARHDEMTKNSRTYYDSVDFDALVADSLRD